MSRSITSHLGRTKNVTCKSDKRVKTRKKNRRTVVHSEQWLFGLHTVTAAILNPNRSCNLLLTTRNNSKRIAEVLDIASRQGNTLPTVEITDNKNIEYYVPDGAVHQGIALKTLPLPRIKIENFLVKKEKVMNTAKNTII